MQRKAAFCVPKSRLLDIAQRLHDYRGVIVCSLKSAYMTIVQRLNDFLTYFSLLTRNRFAKSACHFHKIRFQIAQELCTFPNDISQRQYSLRLTICHQALEYRTSVKKV